MANEVRFKLGDRVRFTQTIEKVQVRGHRGGIKTKYREAGLPGFLKAFGGEAERSEINEGIIVRVRSLSEYESWREAADYEGGIGFDQPSYYTVVQSVPDTARLAYEVAYHINRKPVLVPVEYLEKIDG